MAGNTITITTVSNTTATVTLSSSDWPDAQVFVQAISRNGGVWATSSGGSQLFYPVSAILTVGIS